ncbi:MAG: hypothetical protein H8E66_35015 [Planctomycetes bacterium]|nr:hypothetical protein [Planctomycetota bacterium]
MPKIIEYPRGSLARSIELAKAVDSLGGKCTTEMCATHMKRKVSGAFMAAVGAAVKFGLIDTSKKQLAVTELYRDYKLAYSDADKQAALKKALLAPPVYERLYARFHGQELPVAILDKLLIREFDVAESDASKVAGYFVDAARDVGLLGDGGVLNGLQSDDDEGDGDDGFDDDSDDEFDAGRDQSVKTKYIVSIRGPGMKSEIQLLEPDDLLIVDAMLTKVRRKLEAAEESGAD